MQKGQSLVEFIFVIPLFFVTIGGTMSLFFLQQKKLSDNFNSSFIQLSESLFPEEEKKSANWDRPQSDFEKELDSLLHSSKAFQSKNKNSQGIFNEKRFINIKKQDSCTYNDSSSWMQNGKSFHLSLCTGSSGYENLSIPWLANTGAQEFTKNEVKKQSILTPSEYFSKKKKKNLISFAGRHFKKNPENALFQKTTASLALPSDVSILQSQCFMDFNHKSCHSTRYKEILSRTSKDSANLQMSACISEITINCGSTAALFPACLAGGIAKMISMAKLGKPSPNCQITNQAITSLFFAAKAKGSILNYSTIGFESKARKNLP